MLKNSVQTYGSLAKFFHWTIGSLIIIMLFFGYLMSGLKLLTIHQITGMVILLLAILRVFWTFVNQHPKLPAQMPVYEKLLARFVQIVLYISMFGMPLSGWAMSTAFGFVPHINGIKLPMPGVTVNQHFGQLMLNVHLIFAYILIGGISLHVIGALKHHFIEKDNVLKSMLPFSK